MAIFANIKISQIPSYFLFKFLLLLTLAVGSTSAYADSTTNHIDNDFLPQPVVQKIQELQLNSSYISYIVTPLNGSDKLTTADTPVNNSDVTNIDEALADNTSVYHALNNTVQFQSQIHRTPASTMKLIPTFVALEQLGKDFTWTTHIYHRGVIIADTLFGDLIIQGSGDPKLTHQRLASLLLQVKEAGIKHIDGNIIIDASIFNHVIKDPALFDGEPLRPYNASPYGALLNFNSIQIDSFPINQQQAGLVYTPKLADYQLPNYVDIRSGRCHSKLTDNLNPIWSHTTLNLQKALPQGCGKHSFYIAHPDPIIFSEKLVKQTWLNFGNTLTGKVTSTLVKDTKANQTKYAASFFLPKSVTPIAHYWSYPLSQQIYDINHYSNNVMTEQLFLSTAAYQNHTMQTVGYDDAIKLVTNWWQQNLNSEPPHMTNGSGLCRDCWIKASSLNDLLIHAYQHPEFATYLNSLGVAGVSGTIHSHKYRLPESKAIGRAWIKTGTLDNVTAMAGYVKGLSGQEYTVVAFINLPATSQHTSNQKPASVYRPALDALIDWVAQH